MLDNNLVNDISLSLTNPSFGFIHNFRVDLALKVRRLDLCVSHGLKMLSSIQGQKTNQCYKICKEEQRDITSYLAFVSSIPRPEAHSEPASTLEVDSCFRS